MEYSDFLAEYEQEANRIRIEDDQIKKDFKKQLKGLINITGLFRWMDEGHDYWLPLEIIDIKKTGEKKSGYGDTETCRINYDGLEYNLYLHHIIAEIKGLNHYYVYQTGYDDSYSGTLLWPLKNGKYLLIEYSC